MHIQTQKRGKNISGSPLVFHNCQQETVTKCSQALEKSKCMHQMQDEVLSKSTRLNASNLYMHCVGVWGDWVRTVGNAWDFGLYNNNII